MDFADLIQPPLIIFMVIVAPLWIIFHYKSLNSKSAGLSEEEHYQLEQMAEVATKLLERVEALEAILDHDSPEWRTRHGK